VPDAVKDLEVETRVRVTGDARQLRGHEPVLLAVHEQCRARAHRGGEVAIPRSTRELAEQRPRRVRVRTGRLRVGVALGGELHEAGANVRVEAAAVGDAQLEGLVGEPLRTEHPGARRHRAVADRRHHEGRESRHPPPVVRCDAAPPEGRVDEHQGLDQIRAPRGDARADHRPHRVADDDGGTGLVELSLHDRPVRCDRRSPVARPRATEPDEIDRRHGRVEAVGERAPDRRPRHRVRTQTVHEQDAPRFAVSGRRRRA
jgi:hypothetical protein